MPVSESTCKGFFGPTGVIEDWQGRGIWYGLALEQPECHERDGLCLCHHWWGRAGRVL